MTSTLLIGIATLLYGIANLFLRHTHPHWFRKLTFMKEKFGDKLGVFLHFIFYSVLPIFIGLSFIDQEIDLRSYVGEQTPVSYVSEYVPTEFTFPKGWFENPNEHPFDFQVFSPQEKTAFSAFLFKVEDFDPSTTPLDVLELQVEDLKAKRDSFKEVQSLERTETESLKIQTVLYQGQTEDQTYLYRFSLLEFKHHPEVFSVVLQVILPERMDRDLRILDTILASAKPS